jgi:hypothetical protein
MMHAVSVCVFPLNQLDDCCKIQCSYPDTMYLLNTCLKTVNSVAA